MARGGISTASASGSNGADASQSIAASPALGDGSPNSPLGTAPRAAPVESWTVTAADVEAWLKTARQGERFIYAHGPTLVHGAAAALVGRLAKAGEVIPHNKRAGDETFNYMIIRNRVRAVRDMPKVDAAMLAVLTELQDAAQGGRRCPSDAGLAAVTGLTVGQAKWQMTKLERDRIIACRFVPTPAEPKFRVVKVVATGAETAMPVGAAR